MTAQIDFLKRAVALNLQSLSLPEWLDEIESLRDQLAASQQREAELMAKVGRLKQVPMKYRRMTFNAELQEENARLQAREAELVAHVERLRDALENVEGALDESGLYQNYPVTYDLVINALAATPAQSLTVEVHNLKEQTPCPDSKTS